VIAEIPIPGARGVAIVHHHPGRLRLRGQVLERRHTAALRVRDALCGMAGVRCVNHNAASGSVLVEYAPEAIEADTILGAVLETGIELEGKLPRADAVRVVIGRARDLNDRVAHATRGAADLHGLVSFALGLGAVTSFVFSNHPKWPRWDNLLYWSYSFFRDVHARDLERRPSNLA
jgi:heavy-metal-associated domain-containing protein